MRILQVGHSRLIQSTSGWGATELLIRNYHKIFSEVAISDFVSTSESWKNHIKKFKPDVIITHNENTLNFLSAYDKNCKIYFISHYAYLKEIYGVTEYFKPKNTSEFFLLIKEFFYGLKIKRLIRRGLKSKKIIPILLDRRLLKQNIFSHAIYIDNYLFSSNLYENNVIKNEMVCIGKIEIRKQQYLLQKYTDRIDFYGPLFCKKFKIDKNYFGEIPNSTLPLIFSQYKALILFSLADLKPLVVIEALMYGLPVIINQNLVDGFDNPYGLIGITSLDDLKHLNLMQFDRGRIAVEARNKYDLNKDTVRLSFIKNFLKE